MPGGESYLAFFLSLTPQKSISLKNNQIPWCVSHYTRFKVECLVDGYVQVKGPARIIIDNIYKCKWIACLGIKSGSSFIDNAFIICRAPSVVLERK